MENSKSKVGYLYKRLERHWKTLRPKTIINYKLAWGKRAAITVSLPYSDIT